MSKSLFERSVGVTPSEFSVFYAKSLLPSIAFCATGWLLGRKITFGRLDGSSVVACLSSLVIKNIGYFWDENDNSQAQKAASEISPGERFCKVVKEANQNSLNKNVISITQSVACRIILESPVVAHFFQEHWLLAAFYDASTKIDGTQFLLGIAEPFLLPAYLCSIQYFK